MSDSHCSFRLYAFYVGTLEASRIQLLNGIIQHDRIVCISFHSIANCWNAVNMDQVDTEGKMDDKEKEKEKTNRTDQ